jgi:phage tail sheath protein FI
MITLNFDRRLTSFVVGDTPFRLAPDATSLNEWATNVRRALETNEVGLVAFDEFFAIYYGAGFTSDNSGNNVVVPPSHMALRVLVLNDQVAFPWFAPAGTRRGGVTNATSSGFVTSEGEFVSVALNTGQRDTLYSNNINPITFLAGSGLVVFGQKTRARQASALDRINVARLIVFMRGQLERLARPYLFEPNDKITRDQIKAAADAFCLELVSLRALFDFLVVCDETNNTPARIDRNELYLDIAIEPVKAVEFIYIPLRIKNTGEIAGL